MTSAVKVRQRILRDLRSNGVEDASVYLHGAHVRVVTADARQTFPVDTASADIVKAVQSA